MIRQRPLALTATIAFSVVAAGFGLATPQRAEAAAPPTVDPVIEWNRTVLQLIRTPGVQPATVHPTRNLAMMFGSIRGAAGRAVVVYQFLGSRAGGGTQSDLRRATHARRARGRRRTGPQCRALRAPPPFLKAARASRIESATVVVARKGKNASARFSSLRRARDSRRSRPGRQP